MGVQAGHSQVVALLLERKASLDAADCEGLAFGARRGESEGRASALARRALEATRC